MTALYRGKMRKPPFSYSIFMLALVEALLWVAPVLEAQNSDKNTFTFSLCDYLEREIVTLKSVTQRWRADEQPVTQDLPDHDDEPDLVELYELQQIYLKEVVETVTLKRLANTSCLEPRTSYRRSKRQALVVHEEQQKKDGRAYSGGTSSKKGKSTDKDDAPLSTVLYGIAERFSWFTLIGCFLLAAVPRCKGTRLLSLMSCLTYMSLANGVQAQEQDVTGDTAVDALATEQEDGYFFLAQSKAVLLLVVMVTIVVYLMLCFWLSVGWLHFAKRLLFGSTKRHRKVEEQDTEAQDSQSSFVPPAPRIDAETETRTASSMRPSMMIDFKFKTNVLHDALITYSSVLNLSTLRDLLFDNEDLGHDDLE